MEPESPNTPKPSSNKGLHAVGTALLIVGSALFGGLAVVLWNRNALSGLRENPTPSKKPSPSPDEEET
jgi:hypothetical protein